MSKLLITTNAAPIWNSIIERKSFLLLASVWRSIPQVSIGFARVYTDSGQDNYFRCVMHTHLSNGEPLQIVAEHTQGELAIETAARRLCRSVMRHSRQRRSGVQRSVATA